MAQGLMPLTSHASFQMFKNNRVWGSLRKAHETWTVDDYAKDSKLPV